jgi:hypothetical protein
LVGSVILLVVAGVVADVEAIIAEEVAVRIVADEVAVMIWVAPSLVADMVGVDMEIREGI